MRGGEAPGNSSRGKLLALGLKRQGRELQSRKRGHQQDLSLPWESKCPAQALFLLLSVFCSLNQNQRLRESRYYDGQRPAFPAQGRRGNVSIGEYPTIPYKQ